MSSLKLAVFISVFLSITVSPLTTAHLSAVNTAISLTSFVTESPPLIVHFWAVMSVLMGLAFFPKPFQLSQEHTVVPSYVINQIKKRVTALSRATPRKAGQFILLMSWGICNSWEFLVWSSLAKAIGHHSRSLNLQTLILCASFNFSALCFETSSLI